jgi:hypothetical protein
MALWHLNRSGIILFYVMITWTHFYSVIRLLEPSGRTWTTRLRTVARTCVRADGTPLLFTRPEPGRHRLDLIHDASVPSLPTPDR